MQGFSLIIPTLNEEGNISTLVERIERALHKAHLPYEILFIDDHSTDATRVRIEEAQHENIAIRVFEKKGVKGKAQSLLEGFQYAQYDTIGFMDADMQYPPEALPAMLARIEEGKADVVVSRRRIHKEPFLRVCMSRTFTFLFSRLLHGLTVDVQAGMKVFTKDVLVGMHLTPTPWTFDLEFLLQARHHGFRIEEVDITFAERITGASKIHVVRSSMEIAWHALRMKRKRFIPLVVPPTDTRSMVGAGVRHNRQHFVTHTTLPHTTSALHTLVPWQRNMLALFFVGIGIGAFLAPLATAIFCMAIVSIIYFSDVLFNLYLVRKSLTLPPDIHFSKQELRALTDEELPVYSILCPLYKEAHILSGFLKAMERLQWPQEKLDILLLLEEDDKETQAAARELSLPPSVRVVVVPHSSPKTKPKACNYGLALVRGEYVVIYDAEDIPEPLQLKKAYLAFRNLPEQVKCLQAKLNYYNPRQNLLTRLFTAEYSLWFDVMLMGMQTLGTTIPLGGTSNHFRTADLHTLEGWDPFNVTEDCDLGARLFRRGYKTAVIDSLTLEEANSNIKNWIRQRSRWMKGYMQTYFVHMRTPFTFAREQGIHALFFQLIVGGKVAFMLINPWMWCATIAYFAAYAVVGPAIESLYPGPIFAMAVISLLFGNFLYLYYYMIGCARQGQWGLMKYVFFVPLYWILMSIASYMALYQLIRKPHYWEKTHHGLHAKTLATSRTAPSSVSVSPRRLLPTGSFMAGSMLAANALNFLFAWIIGRALSFEHLSAVTLMTTFWSLLSLFFGAVSATVNQETALGMSRNTPSRGITFLKDVLRMGMFLLVPATLVWLGFTPFLHRFFQLTNLSLLLVSAPLGIIGFFAYAQTGYLQGRLSFHAVGVLFFLESLTKCVVAMLCIAFGAPELTYIAIPLSLCITWGASAFFIRQDRRLAQETAEHAAFPFSLFFASLLSGLSTTAFLSVDILLVKHYFSPNIAGSYALLATIGKMLYFLGSLPNSFMVSLVSRDEGLAHSSYKTFSFLLGVSGILTVGSLLGLQFFGHALLPFIFGERVQSIVPLLPLYALGMAFFTFTNVFVTYYVAKRTLLFPILSCLPFFCMLVGVFRHHATLLEVIQIFFLSSIAGFLLIMCAHLCKGLSARFLDLFHDARDMFFPTKTLSSEDTTGQRILIFNWRDRRHIFSGGAEVYVEEMAKQWIAEGHHVTLFCGNDGHSPRNEIVDGIHIIRRGGFYLVYVWAFLYYIWSFRGQFDVLIDSANGVPFFSPIYVRIPVFCLLHHIHQEVFKKSLPFPLSFIAQRLERTVMPLVYKRTPFITVSESSKQDIRALGLGKAGIEIVHPGIHVDRLTTGHKHPTPLLVYLGRLKEYKSIDVLLHAFQRIHEKIPQAHLYIAGTGEEEMSLKQLTHALGLQKVVEFLGYVSEEEKISLLQKAWVVVNPSFMEGWGITTIEANACGTPVVASDVPGLRDSVQTERTGLLAPYGDSDALATCILHILENADMRQEMEQEAATWAQSFDWQHTSKQFLSVMNEYVDEASYG